jgi:hypothetical protein
MSAPPAQPTQFDWLVYYDTEQDQGVETAIPALSIPIKSEVIVQMPAAGSCDYRLHFKVPGSDQDSYIDNTLSLSADQRVRRVSTGTNTVGVPCAPVFQVSIPGT